MLSYKYKATVIILGYNGRRYIERCLGSVLDQDLPADGYEVIWADNASTDGSAEYVKRQFPTVRVAQFDSNYGFAEGYNRAIKEASGHYLVLLNQDTIVHKSWLRTLVEVMEANPDLGACQANMLMPWHKEFYNFERRDYPDTVYFTEIGRYGFVEYWERPMQKGPIATTFTTAASCIINRSVIERMPYVFDPLFGAYSEDLDFSLRLKSLGYRAAVAPRAVVYHLQDSPGADLGAALRKAYLATRNRIVAYYKSMPYYRFLIFLPTLVFGTPLKIKQLHVGRVRAVLIMASMLPLSLGALIGAIRLIPRYRGYKEKRETLHDEPLPAAGNELTSVSDVGRLAHPDEISRR
jgi:GT2 family glycosyltransferase